MSTKEALIKVTAELLQQKGYFGTGISEVLKNTNAPKGSLYHHFPKGKDDLVNEALKLSGQELSKKFKKAFDAGETILESLNNIIDLLIDDLSTSAFERGSPITTTALELCASNETISQTVKSIYESWIAELTASLKEKGVPQAEEKSKLFLCLVEGGLVISKATKSIKYLQDLKLALPKVI